MISTAALFLIKAVVFVYGLITYPIYALIYLPCRKRVNRQRARVVSRTADEITYRINPLPCPLRDEIINQPENIDTMEKMFTFMVRKHGARKALGTRTVIKEIREPDAKSGKLFTKLVLGDYTWIKYTEMAETADHFGKGLREFGVRPRDKVCIFADTRAEWLIAATGCWKNSIALATIYTNLGEDGIVHGINQTNVDFVITSVELLPKITAILDQVPSVKNVVVFENPLKPAFEPTIVRPNGQLVGVIGFKEVVQRGAESQITTSPPSANDTAIVMYTSGSTGVPKGVVLSHLNMVSACLSLLPTAVRAITTEGAINENDAFVAFLPLAHVLEMLAEHLVLLVGIKIGYSSPNTLTDKSTMIIDGAKGDATVLQPTVMAAVPLILDRIYKGILSNVSSRGEFSKALINWCIGYKTSWMKRGFETPIMNKIIFAKMKQVVGGRLRVLMSGGAPLNEDAHEFIRTCLSLKMMQGYGLTETCATACLSDPNDLRTGIVGPPLLGVDLKIRSVAEMGYTVTDSQGPRGEIIIGGNAVAKGGYYNMPTKTREDFYTEDGTLFFCSGDIGQILEDGSVKIIDRKKDLVKLQGGEYVSLGKVEACLKTNPIVDNVCVFADPMKTASVALVVPDEAKLKQLASDLGIPANVEDREALCRDPAVNKSILETLIKHGEKGRLQKFEIPRQVRLVSEPWTPENDMVTAAFKLKRKPIQNRYQDIINAMYTRLENPGSSAISMNNNNNNNMKIGLNNNNEVKKQQQKHNSNNNRSIAYIANNNKIVPT